MATNQSFQLYINADNVAQYFDASGGVFNGAAIGGKYITMRTNAVTATFTANDACRNILFPSSAAKANKLEVWAQGIARPSSSRNTIDIALAGADVVASERLNYDLSEYNGSISGSFDKVGFSVIYTLKVANIFYAAGIRDTLITTWFRRCACAANAAGNGVVSVAVSDAAPWDGDSVTFTATMKPGATWHGWYGDAACTQLVSAEQTYTTAAADLTLYAKATVDVTGAGVYIRTGGEYTEAVAAYRKVGGAWVQQADGGKAALQNGRYKVTKT